MGLLVDELLARSWSDFGATFRGTSASGSRFGRCDNPGGGAGGGEIIERLIEVSPGDSLIGVFDARFGETPDSEMDFDGDPNRLVGVP